MKALDLIDSLYADHVHLGVEPIRYRDLWISPFIYDVDHNIIPLQQIVSLHIVEFDENDKLIEKLQDKDHTVLLSFITTDGASHLSSARDLVRYTAYDDEFEESDREQQNLLMTKLVRSLLAHWHKVIK
jgi:hypothetical protein